MGLHLPRAVRPQHAEDLRLAHAEADVVHGHDDGAPGAWPLPLHCRPYHPGSAVGEPRRVKRFQVPGRTPC